MDKKLSITLHSWIGSAFRIHVYYGGGFAYEITINGEYIVRDIAIECGCGECLDCLVVKALDERYEQIEQQL